MKFFMLVSPTIRFLLNKHLGNLSTPMQNSTAVKKFHDHKILLPEDVKQFIQVLMELRDHLVANNLANRIVALQKFVGLDPSWKGLVPMIFEMGHDVYLYPYEPGLIQSLLEPFQNLLGSDPSTVRVIAPLNLDEVEEIYTFFHSLMKVPVYPFIQNLITSKWLASFTFSPFAPRTFFFPQGTNACDFLQKVQKIARVENIKHFILKDEYDFDIRPIIPYTITPVDTLAKYVTNFNANSGGIANIGGLLLEEFLGSDNMLHVMRSHVCNGMIPGGDFRTTSNLRNYERG